MSIINLTAPEVASLLAQDKIILIDVREPQEYMAERIPGALLFPLSSFDATKLPADTAERPVVFHCGAGVRSAKAVAQCQNAGLPHSRHMVGGMGGWKSAKLPYLRLDMASGQMCEIC